MSNTIKADYTKENNDKNKKVANITGTIDLKNLDTLKEVQLIDSFGEFTLKPHTNTTYNSKDFKDKFHHFDSIEVNSKKSDQDSTLVSLRKQSLRQHHTSSTTKSLTHLDSPVVDLSNLTFNGTSYEVLEVLGEGSYGSVYKGLNKEEKKIIAIKIIPIEFSNQSESKELMKEIEFLKKSQSPYIVGYHSSFILNDKTTDEVRNLSASSDLTSRLCIIMDFCEAGSVSDLMQATRMTLAEEELQVIVSCVVLGLESLHKCKIIHRDIKAGNILLTRTGIAKVADFGVSCQLNTMQSKRDTAIGTPYWMAPEVIEKGSYNEIADVWSLGISCIEMAEGEPPFSNLHPMRALFVIPKKPPPTVKEPEDWSNSFNNFLAECLKKESTARPTMSELKTHPFLNATIEGMKHLTNQDKSLYNEFMSFTFRAGKRTNEICESQQILMQLVEEALPAIEKARTKKGTPKHKEQKETMILEKNKTLTLGSTDVSGNYENTASFVNKQRQRSLLQYDFNIENLIGNPNISIERGKKHTKEKNEFFTLDSHGTLETMQNYTFDETNNVDADYLKYFSQDTLQQEQETIEPTSNETLKIEEPIDVKEEDVPNKESTQEYEKPTSSTKTKKNKKGSGKISRNFLSYLFGRQKKTKS